MNSRFVFNFGENSLTGFLNYSDRREVDYQDVSLEMVSASATTGTTTSLTGTAP
jgi:hypothetical protein